MSSHVSLKGVKYNIVQLQPEHISPVLDIFDRAGKNEMQAALWPLRLSTPDDPSENRRFRSKMLENRLKSGGATPMLIAVSDDEAQRVLGYAGWSVPDMDGLRRALDPPPKSEEKMIVGTTQSASEDRPKMDEKEEGDGIIDDGQGGKRGDGKKLPMGLDIGLQSKIKQMVMDAKKELLGLDENNVLCKPSLWSFRHTEQPIVQILGLVQANDSSQTLGLLGPILNMRLKESLRVLFNGA